MAKKKLKINKSATKMVANRWFGAKAIKLNRNGSISIKK